MKKATRTKTVPPREEKPEVKKEHGGVQSIARAFAIAEEIARNREGISLAELSKRVGLHNSTTFHLVKTMVQLGYVSQLADSRKYRIGRRMFTLAAGALDEIELVNVATPVLEKLTGATGEYSHFAIRSGEQIVVVAKIAGTGIFQMVDRTGAVRPAHATALGKVLLAANRSTNWSRPGICAETRELSITTSISFASCVTMSCNWDNDPMRSARACPC